MKDMYENRLLNQPFDHKELWAIYSLFMSLHDLGLISTYTCTRIWTYFGPELYGSYNRMPDEIEFTYTNNTSEVKPI